MGVASHVGGNGSQRHGETNRLGVNEPKADKSAPSIISGKISHACGRDGADHVGNSCSDKTSCGTVNY